MDEKYKVRSIEEPSNELLKKRVKENKKFVMTLLATVVSSGNTVLFNSMLNNSNMRAAAIFLGIMASLSTLCTTFHAGTLIDMYNKRETKEDEVEEDENKNDMEGKTE